MECIVQGVIEEKNVPAFHTLLLGLCGTSSSPVRCHEICLSSAPNLGAVESEIHVMCDLLAEPPKWTVQHIGSAMRGAVAEQLPAAVRTLLSSAVTENALPVFLAMGYRINYELLREGATYYCVRQGVPLDVTILTVSKLPVLHDLSQAVSLTPGLLLVQVCTPAAPGKFAEPAAAIASLAEHLARYVRLSKPGVLAGFPPA